MSPLGSENVEITTLKNSFKGDISKQCLHDIVYVRSSSLFDIEVGSSNRGSGTVYKISSITEVRIFFLNFEFATSKKEIKNTKLQPVEKRKVLLKSSLLIGLPIC